VEKSSPQSLKDEAMSNPALPPDRSHASTAWWREPQVAALIVLVVAAYFVRLGAVSMRGEEPSRAFIAFSFLDGGDWIVPRVYGDILHSRPPLQNWLIAASSVVLGSHEPWAVRLHSAVAMLCTTLLIYGYARSRLSRGGAFAAACAFATFGEMFTTGAQAETDMLFAALFSAALFLWHWGQLCSWPALRTWCVSYVLVGLAVLCKGPQAPIYFGTTVTAYLVITGQGRRLFTVAHLAGMVAGAAVVLAWLVPCIYVTSWTDAKLIVVSDSAARMLGWNATAVAAHLVQFPLEVLGCTLPWSPLLFAYASRTLRRALGPARPLVLFMTLAVALAFPTIWLPPDGQTRYFTPLYPCLAVLIGSVVDCVLRSDAAPGLRAGWRHYTVALTTSMIGAAAAVLVAAGWLPYHPRFDAWAEPLPWALGYAVALLAAAALTWRGRVQTAVLAIAGFMVVAFTGYFTDVRIRRSEDPAGMVARLKTQLPPNQMLVNFGAIDLTFAYYFDAPVDERPMPKSPADWQVAENGCFSFYSVQGWRPKLPFAWDEMAVIPMTRNRSTDSVPDRAMVVGRRLPDASTQTRMPPVAPVGYSRRSPVQ
jgi:4-amino-4-deoxy-L-arabinose transferase-like glycosyltransferase